MNTTDHWSLLIEPPLDDDDLHQEAEVLRLLGKTPNLSILRKKMKRNPAFLHPFDQDIPTAVPLELLTDPVPSLDVIERLTTWAMDQSADIAEMIYQFLEDPRDEVLSDVISSLTKRGTIEKTEALRPKKPLSVVSMVLQYLESRFYCTKEELYEYVRSIHVSERPEATTRQLIRRLLKEQKIKEISNGVYSLP